jgi:TonB family protein
VANGLLVSLLIRSHKYEKSNEYNELFLQQFPNDPSALSNKADLLSALKKDYAQALEIRMNLLRVSDFNKNGSVYYEIAATYSLMNKLDESLKYLKLALSISKGWGNTGNAQVNSDFENLRKDSRFWSLVGERPPLVQSVAPSTNGDLPAWKRFTGKNEEFSILMPGQPSSYLNAITDRSNKLIPEQIYSSYFNGAVYLVVAYGWSSSAEALENFSAHHSSRGAISNARDVTSAGFKGKEYDLKFGETVGTLRIFQTKNHAYAVATVQAVDDLPLREYFLSSLLLSGGRDNQLPPAQAPAQPPSQTLNVPQSNSTLSILFGKDVTRRGVIVSKPEPWYTDEARRFGVSGTVVLRAVLSASGEVTDIRTIKTLPNGLTENAIEAARHLKFIPGIKDGRFVSYWVELQYNFGFN